MPTYSFGEDSPLKFEISDKLAKNYNEAVEKFLKAHRRFSQKYNRKWNPFDDPIVVKWTRSQQKAWNEIAELFNVLTTGNNHEAGPFHPNDFMDDFLIKNAAQKVPVLSKGMRHVLTLAAVSGALYGALRGL